jgi:SAM-dependent methyltransferase
MGRWSHLLADEFLNWLSLPPNLRWLDVCCGSGVLAEAIVERCAPARVAGIDASLQQIEFARLHRAHPAVNFECGDAMALPFAEATFDVAVCGLGLNFVAEPERALQEMRRVTISDGLIAVYVWDYAEGARFLRQFWDAAAAVDREALGYDQARRFPLCNPEALGKLFEGACSYLATRDESTRSAMQERLRSSLTTDAEGAIELLARAWAIRGRR